MQGFDVVVVGAGAAGLFCAGRAGQAGLRVLLIDHAAKVAEKIRISGGGRCNFTNREAGPANFLSENPAFCRSALARYTPQDFIKLVQQHGIAFHEKHKGQLFCDDSAEQIIQMLLRECEAGGVTRWQPCTVADVRLRAEGGFELDTSQGTVQAPRLVVATGGLPVPKIGASDWGCAWPSVWGTPSSSRARHWCHSPSTQKPGRRLQLWRASRCRSKWRAAKARRGVASWKTCSSRIAA